MRLILVCVLCAICSAAATAPASAVCREPAAQSGSCSAAASVGAPLAAQREPEPRRDRNYVADAVAAVLGIVAVILIVRRRRQLRR